MDADDLSLLDSVITEGGISAAAVKMKLPKATVSRRLRRLEHAAGAPLFDRTGRKLRLTLLGQQLAAPAARLRASLAEARSIAEAAHTGHGQIRVASPFLFGRIVLSSFMARFLAQHESLTGILKFDNALVDPLRDEFDIAVRIARPVESYLTVAKLASVSLQLYASPALAARIRKIGDIGRCPAVNTSNHHEPRVIWQLKEGSRQIDAEVDVRCTVNDPEAACSMVAQGIGLGPLPTFLARHLVENGKIVPVLPRLTAGQIDIHAVLPPGRLKIPVVRKFFDGLRKELTAQRFGK